MFGAGGATFLTRSPNLWLVTIITCTFLVKIHGGENTQFSTHTSLTCPSPSLADWSVLGAGPACSSTQTSCQDLVMSVVLAQSWAGERTEKFTLTRDPRCSTLHRNYGGQSTFPAPFTQAQCEVQPLIRQAVERTANWEQCGSLSSLPLAVPAERHHLLFVLVLRSRLWLDSSAEQGLGGGTVFIQNTAHVCVLSVPAHRVSPGCFYSSSAGRGKRVWLIGSRWTISMGIWFWMSKGVATSMKSVCSWCWKTQQGCVAMPNCDYINIKRIIFFALIFLLKPESHWWGKAAELQSRTCWVDIK